jgi:hypothetical protein
MHRLYFVLRFMLCACFGLSWLLLELESLIIRFAGRRLVGVRIVVSASESEKLVSSPSDSSSCSPSSLPQSLAVISLDLPMTSSSLSE